MNAKGTERINEEGAVETRVETVDTQSPPGENKEPRRESVGVVHLTRDRHNSGDKGGVLAAAAGAVTKGFQSVKDAISGRGHDSNK